MQLEIVIPGPPQAKMRHRLAKKTMHHYDPNIENEDRAIAHIRFVTKDHVPFIGALRVDEMVFVFARPKGHFGTGKNAGKLKPSAPEYCTDSKDVDNMEKFYFDAMNCVVYVDDRQIVKVKDKEKRFAAPGETPHVRIAITPLEPQREGITCL